MVVSGGDHCLRLKAVMAGNISIALIRVEISEIGYTVRISSIRDTAACKCNNIVVCLKEQLMVLGHKKHYERRDGRGDEWRRITIRAH